MTMPVADSLLERGKGSLPRPVKGLNTVHTLRSLDRISVGPPRADWTSSRTCGVRQRLVAAYHTYVFERNKRDVKCDLTLATHAPDCWIALFVARGKTVCFISRCRVECLLD